jgi:uncharacterized protein (TIGR02217 family)
MTGFIETPRFPDEIAAWAVGGRGFQTIVTDTYGGIEYRNAAWSQSRGVYDVAEALRETNPNATYAFKALRNMFRVVMGQEYAFRFKDYQDFKDEGGGIFVQLTSTTFQMYKHYAISPLSYNQIVQKPVSATVAVTGGVSPVVDYTTGIVTVSSGTPTSWTGEFDVPVRFAEDMPQVGLDQTGAFYNWQSLKLIEVRNP